MYCQSCGAKNDDGAASCVYCGKPLATWRRDEKAKSEEQSNPSPNQPYTQPPPPLQQPQQNYNNYGQRPPYTPVENVPDYLAFSIIVTILCCIPTGIVAIIFSSQVKSKTIQGDMAGAWASSRTALGWCWASLIIGFIGVLINAVSFALGLFGSLAGM